MSGCAGEDFTAAYWDLMAEIQLKVVPTLEKLKAMFGDRQPDNKVTSKLTEILTLLPRLKARACLHSN